MKQTDKITLTIEAEQPMVRMESCQNGIYSSKLIALDDLADCFLRSQKKPMIHSGLLPPDCLSYSEGERGWCSMILLFPERYCASPLQARCTAIPSPTSTATGCVPEGTPCPAMKASMASTLCPISSSPCPITMITIPPKTIGRAWSFGTCWSS